MPQTPPINNCEGCKVANGTTLVPSGFVAADDFWTVNHLLEKREEKYQRGRLVLQPRRHVEAFHELNSAELARFAPLLSRLDEAMREVLKPEKVYICLFAEAKGWEHLHFHLIPRYADLPLRGPALVEHAAEVSPEVFPRVGLADVEKIVHDLRTYLAGHPRNP